ncbi:nuclear transport factor 2 family protein [Paraburkholderia hospita]|uniref:nuclear transport factor 2 family protein n=1 Tax=Paraburkholderia hospita TaxID=169430 RepID=UPI0009A75FB7|nr:nuclear transport factor 2 family protein [Paraburkholderia hospita]OUL78599.1 polyketide cyclase [Paraburkholderia hospita]SKC75498.1 SnoaL-like domain-containing protein [Burkholderia sp. CF099]
MSTITLPSDTIEALLARVASLEAENAVRKTIARYMALCDVPSGALDSETLAALFTQDAIWEGIGPQYTQKFGHLRGHEAILAMLQRYLPPVPHFATNVHFLTSETIAVDGVRAKGRWIMLQASGYVDARAELIAARLEIDFVPAQDGRNWLIQHFRTERLFDAPWQVNARKDTTS